ncbi:hypothetical protein ACJMK2_013640 [Sinanodonta woodiana]|uniref:Uncharacterized protein n=1 Tax=Sinanodonta woodiana TaxID=1069815 RepID=A0ABD3V184_SINWO
MVLTRITENIGFWDYCVTVKFYGLLHSECGKLYESNRSDMTDASAAMLLIGMLVMAGSIVMCVISTFCLKENRRLPIIGGVCNLFAGLCMLVGVALFGYEYRQDVFIGNLNLHVAHAYGPSVYMAIVATFLALVSGNIQIASVTIFTKPIII